MAIEVPQNEEISGGGKSGGRCLPLDNQSGDQVKKERR